MDVSAENCCHVARQFCSRYHIRTAHEREVSRAAGCTLDAVVQAEELHIGGRDVSACVGEEGSEPVANLAGIGKARERHADSARLEDDGAQSVEDVEVAVKREERVGHAAVLVVTRKQKDWNAAVRDAPQRIKGSIREPGRDAAPV